MLCKGTIGPMEVVTEIVVLVHLWVGCRTIGLVRWWAAGERGCGALPPSPLKRVTVAKEMGAKVSLMRRWRKRLKGENGASGEENAKFPFQSVDA